MDDDDAKKGIGDAFLPSHHTSTEKTLQCVIDWIVVSALERPNNLST